MNDPIIINEIKKDIANHITNAIYHPLNHSSGPHAVADSIEKLIDAKLNADHTENEAVEKCYTPTDKPRFCNQSGPMGGGCKDSWHVGGNYGSHVCRNPEHHDKADHIKQENDNE